MTQFVSIFRPVWPWPFPWPPFPIPPIDVV
jgi:hypothetical protein